MKSYNKQDIRNVRPPDKPPYYCLYKNNKFIKTIGNADALAKWQQGQDKALAILNPVKITTPDMPSGTFDIIYADPPWRYEFSETTSREVENQYPTMELKAIKKIGRKVPCSPDSVLLLWATAPKLEEALTVINAWGFRYITSAAWDKDIIGMGYWFRGQHELLLLGKKGNYPAPLPENRFSSLFRERRGEHSAKPQLFYEVIEKMFPNAKYLEMFARLTHPGWTAWGNQC